MPMSSSEIKVNDIINKLMIAESKKIDLQKFNPDYDFSINKEEAEDVLERSLRKRMSDLQHRLYAERKKGVDTSGKDGTIRNVISAFNPQGCTVKAFKEPTAEDLSHDFLWRIHKGAPAKGEIVTFNRSHYEDIIQPRVHKIVRKSIWSQRYEYINSFERCLLDNGTKTIKFFLHISKEEQRKRLEERLTDPSKQWKISERDIKDLKFYNSYTAVYQDIIKRCSNLWTPWYIIPANKKWFRNLAVGLIIVNTLERMRPKFPKLATNLSKIVIDN